MKTLVVAGLTVAGLVTLMLGTSPSKATAAGSAPVMVTNTPLPVQGTINAAQSGSWTIHDADNPALHPYTDTCTVQTPAALSVGCTTGAPPQGTTLVVEEVDVFLLIPSGQGLFPFNGFGGNAAIFPLTFVGTDGTNDRYVGHQLTRMYQPSNAALPGCGAALNASPNVTVTIVCNITGHLV